MSDLNDEISPPVEVPTITGRTFYFRRMLMEDWGNLKAQVVRKRKERLYADINREIEADDWQKRMAAKAAVDTEIESVATIHYLMDYCRLDPTGIIDLLTYAMIDDSVTDLAERKKLLTHIQTTQQMQVAAEIVLRPTVAPANPSSPVASADGSGGRTGAVVRKKRSRSGRTSSPASAENSPAATPAS